MICYYPDRMRYLRLFIVLLLFAPAFTYAAEPGLVVTNARQVTHDSFTRMVFEVEAAGPYVLTTSSDGGSIILGSYEAPLVLKAPLPQVRDGVVSSVEPWRESGRTYVVVHLADAGSQVEDFTLRDPDRIVIDIRKKPAPVPAARGPNQQTVVVLDAGHGGKDIGIPSGQGLEKTFTLELARRVRRQLSTAPAFKTLLTREGDRSLSLDERAAAANAAHATLVVVLHAASGDTTRVSLQDVMEDADVLPQPGSFAQPAVASTDGWGSQQARHARESRDLGRAVVRELTGVQDAEPHQAPLAALRSIDAAAIFVEIGMQADPAKTAEKIAKGIEHYAAEH
jgi:N-acetylmuramoyl-L-alanine amidase